MLSVQLVCGRKPAFGRHDERSGALPRSPPIEENQKQSHPTKWQPQAASKEHQHDPPILQQRDPRRNVVYQPQCGITVIIQCICAWLNRCEYSDRDISGSVLSFTLHLQGTRCHPLLLFSGAVD